MVLASLGRTLPIGCGADEPPGNKWHMEIMFTQLTKTRGFTAGSCWEERFRDFDLAIGDQDPVDQECDQGPLLLACGLSSPGCRTRWQNASRDVTIPASFALPIALSFQLFFLGCQGVLFLCQFLAPPLMLR